MARKPRAPWKKSNPRQRAGQKTVSLTSAQKSTAKARAKRAGRRYPNLVDNMREAAVAKTSAKKSSSKKTAKRTGRKRAAHKSTTRQSFAAVDV